MKKKVLITGASGMLGKAMAKQFVLGDWTVVSLQHKESPKERAVLLSDYSEIDITSRESIRDVFAFHRPDIVINCAARTDVDGIEKEWIDAQDKDTCREETPSWKVNVTGPELLTDACEFFDARLVLFGSDQVYHSSSFDSSSSEGRGSSSDYVNFYAEQKKAMRHRGSSKHLTLVTSWLVDGVSEGCMVKRLLDPTGTILQAAIKVSNAVTDQVSKLTYTHDLAAAVERLLFLNATGTFNFANSGACTPFDVAEMLGVTSLTPVTWQELRERHPSLIVAERPKWSVLNTQRVSELLGDTPITWGQVVYLCQDNYVLAHPPKTTTK